MSRFQESAVQAAKIADFKRLITSGTFETLEKLEDAVDAFLWADEDARAQWGGSNAGLIDSHRSLAG